LIKKKRPVLRQGARFALRLVYQVFDPWHPGEPQVPVDALKFRVLTMSFVPLLCVAEFTVVLL
jgi:hypothetical protein